MTPEIIAPAARDGGSTGTLAASCKQKVSTLRTEIHRSFGHLLDVGLMYLYNNPWRASVSTGCLESRLKDFSCSTLVANM